MASRLRSNPKFPEGINRSNEHPLKEFAWLLAGVTVALMIAVFTLSLLVGWLAPSIPFRWEQQLTGWYEQSQNESISQDSTHGASPLLDGAEQAIEELGATLVATQMAVDGAVDDEIQYHFHLLSDPSPNAFATLGGHIFVTTGLLHQVHSENALAMVMAHEMAHISARHPVQALSRGALLQFLMLMIVGGQGADAVSGVLGQAGLLTVLSFNRDMEREADGSAMDLLLAHYHHLQGADEFFQNMLNRHGDIRWSEWAQTHPGVGERLASIQSRSRSGETDDQLTPLDQRLTAWLQWDSDQKTEEVLPASN
ncbi:M48 family metallopeptidase [Pseudomaricurvus sp.]|uniref:M48 family metallopeptidase n=1 Tax=Pseudomaricurvus sp. TaxID=2004510 RepID=UPI003F6CAA8A